MLKRTTIGVLVFSLLLIAMTAQTFGSWTSWFSSSQPTRETQSFFGPSVPLPSISSVPGMFGSPQTSTFFPSNPPSIDFAFHAQPILWKETISFRNDQWNGAFSQTRTEVGVSANLLDWLRVRYSLVPTLTVTDIITPTKSFVVNQVDFGVTSTTNGQGSNGTSTGTPKPVSLEWTEATNHKLTFTGLINYSLKPCAVLKIPTYTLTATSERDGKVIKESETFRRVLWGLGGNIDYTSGRTKVEALFVGSPQYLLAEGKYSCRLLFGLSGFLGGFWEQIKFGDLKVINYGPWAGASVAF